MEFRFQFLMAMREQNPKLFRRLSRSGELDRFVEMKSSEAAKLFQELTKDAPKEPGGYPQQPWAREAEEHVKALLFEFSDDQTGPEQDENNAFNGLLPPQSQGMRFGSGQHQKMADLLYQKARNELDDRKRDKITKMADVFRRLAQKAAKRNK